MASNPTPDNNDILRALADRMADGCHTHEATIGIKQNTEPAIRGAIAGLGSAESAVGMKKLAVDDAFTAQQAADEAGKTTLMNCKLRLAQKLGNRWNAGWEPTGFPNQSTAIPDSQDGRLTLLNDLATYFTNMPANESVDMDATTALCLAAQTALSDARQGVGNANSERRNADDDSAQARTWLVKQHLAIRSDEPKSHQKERCERSAATMMVLAARSTSAKTIISQRGYLYWNAPESPLPVTMPTRAHIICTALING